MGSEMTSPEGEQVWRNEAPEDGAATAGDGLWKRAAMLGFATGLRSITPMALLLGELSSRRVLPDLGDLQIMATPGAALALRIAAIGELAGDKTPFAPSRLKPPALAARVATAGFVGYLLAIAEAKDPIGPALVAACSGLAGSLAGYAWRVGMAKLTGLPDWPLALLEDGATYLISRAGVR